MQLLLDTNAFLWFIVGSLLLSKRARVAIEDPTNEKFVSLVSLWEIAIKFSIGKLPMSAPYDKLFPQQIYINGFNLLEIQTDHIAEIVKLPFHHRDPFDRLLIAQSIVSKMTIVSIDKVFDDYNVQRLW